MSRALPLLAIGLAVITFSSDRASAQCSLSNATSCVCETAGQTQCDLLPDLTISWYALENYSSGPSEYSQTSTQGGRLRVTGSTPNIGHGPLEVRTADMNGYRRFICDSDTFLVTGQTNFFCPNGQEPKQVLHQRVYRKEGNNMVWNEVMTGNMTYHSNHNHYHVDDWTTMTLRMEQADEPDPRKWPVLATGAKVGFCLMDYGSCGGYNGHCRTAQEYGQGSTLVNADFPNYGLFGGYGCGTNVQGISVGRTDIYSESLNMMWINMMDGLCNGNYWIVAEVDPTNVFLEENDENNWTAIPFTLTQQRPSGSGGVATILAEEGARAAQGGTVKLTATPGYSYLWSNGATTRSIEVDQPGNYTVTVTAPCGTLVSAPVTVSMVSPPVLPTATGDEVMEGESAQLSASGTGLRWFTGPDAEQPVGTGGTFDTPTLTETTSYWVEASTMEMGTEGFGAKTDLSGSLNSSDFKQSLFFDAYEPFELVSVKVYATGNGDRHFVLWDNVGNLLEERYVYMQGGEQRVDLNFHVPAGTGHRITAFNDNTEIVRNLHRDNSGVSYPYALAGLGAITGSTAGGGYYYYLYDWEVRTPTVVSSSARVEVVAEVMNGVLVAPKVFLDGPYVGGTGLMDDALRTGGLIPLVEPYTAAGYAHMGGGGGESIDAGVLSVSGNDAIVDWVVVELRDKNDPAQVLATRSALLQRDGDVVGTNGMAPVRFELPNEEYYVAVRHRNHLGVMTAASIMLDGTVTPIDMSLPGTAVYGVEARRNDGGTMTLWSGNVVPDNALKYTGSSNDRDAVLVAIGGLTPTATTNGYLPADANLDGVVKYVGANNDRDKILSSLGGTNSTATRIEQLPAQ